jgi:hypothetical protein
MLHVSPALLRHLVAGSIRERDRLASVLVTVEGDWPAGFDANDIPLYDSLITYLSEALREGRSEIALFGKPLVFILRTIPAYVASSRASLTAQERQNLKTFYTSAWPPEIGPPEGFPG